jgi:asparagine synthase (glutamine-hydrolysing)
MCGIAGFISRSGTGNMLKRMGDTLYHRGPDETGYYLQGDVGLVSKRLSIIDLHNGKQPVFNENRDIAVVFNGEIFNYAQLRQELEDKGHKLSNHSDTAVLPHLYEEYGTAMFTRLSGQFAIAVYQISQRKLILARDRMGILPLHFACQNGEFYFGSEIKAILASERVKRQLCGRSLLEVFTFWSPQSDRTVFQDVFSVQPGEFLVYQEKTLQRQPYYRLKFGRDFRPASLDETVEEVEELLCRAVQKRLIGDVKISAYLSGGLDSSLVTSIVASRFNRSVEAFSVGFEEARYDERKYQKLVSEHLGIRYHTVLFRNEEIPGLIQKIVRHTETPLLRAGPAPLYRLSELVNRNGIKVVLSGEGADEFFGGYDIFREVKIRGYLNRYPDSEFKKNLFRKVNLFSDSRIQSASAGSLNYFYMHGHEDGLVDSHYTRWRQFGFFERFFSEEAKQLAKETRHPDYFGSLDLDTVPELGEWTEIQRCQYLEIKTFLSRYLLSSQGDRISMANSVEVRFPFLDDDLAEYCMSLNDRYKIRALNEKVVLKRIAEKYLPRELVYRKKYPYRAPIPVDKILEDPYLKHILSEESLRRFNLFHPQKIKGFLDGVRTKETPSERETMLVMGVLTTQLLCDIFHIETW